MSSRIPKMPARYLDHDLSMAGEEAEAGARAARHSGPNAADGNRTAIISLRQDDTAVLQARVGRGYPGRAGYDDSQDGSYEVGRHAEMDTTDPQDEKMEAAALLQELDRAARRACLFGMETHGNDNEEEEEKQQQQPPKKRTRIDLLEPWQCEVAGCNFGHPGQPPRTKAGKAAHMKMHQRDCEKAASTAQATVKRPASVHVTIIGTGKTSTWISQAFFLQPPFSIDGLLQLVQHDINFQSCPPVLHTKQGQFYSAIAEDEMFLQILDQALKKGRALEVFLRPSTSPSSAAAAAAVKEAANRLDENKAAAAATRRSLGQLSPAAAANKVARDDLRASFEDEILDTWGASFSKVALRQWFIKQYARFLSLQPALYAQRKDISKPPDSATLRLLQQKILLPGFEDPTAQKVMG